MIRLFLCDPWQDEEVTTDLPSVVVDSSETPEPGMSVDEMAEAQEPECPGMVARFSATNSEALTKAVQGTWECYWIGTQDQSVYVVAESAPGRKVGPYFLRREVHSVVDMRAAFVVFEGEENKEKYVAPRRVKDDRFVGK